MQQLTSMLRKAEEKMAQLKACKQIGDDSQSQETPARPHVNLGMGLELGLGIGSKLEPARPESWQAGKSSRLQTDALHRDSSGVSLELSLGSGHEFLSTLRPYPLPPWRGNSMPATLPDLNAVGVGEKRSRAEDSEEVIQP